jgi:hypothetical protein
MPEYLHWQSDLRVLEKNINAKRLAPDCKALRMFDGEYAILGWMGFE